ncbi:endonuclease/exonuclease/phosphatase family protein [Sphaerotilus montanus]|jgi:endonuclease/exonuclease/phosphatase family metal-dependent hydrolase|uniref:Endonuclease/exonuclease/phosphatase family metal-dependent hydrolase n=1 Tax=Sphaerotilus montanus TaxID=522889 RepID=A0A7Y9U762_9BURK|nr:endonuclease/exonuclease/phosphatase family protein [Sphaerotilus montanus]NYG34798.1 endonuclease/exonuclease/phosphatase family metal-dependent hydrolase [Sphaerotilus montanus]NZD55603.1 endonuclease/exonuclease/phosphatase family protein [Sphaerotilus montanus]
MQRQHLHSLALSLTLGLAAGAASAADVTVATWNLGWHLDAPLATRWIAACGQKFSKSADGLWRPDAAGPKTGWQLRWGRDAKIEWDIGQLPPCDVWQSRFKPVPVTEAALAKRRQQIAEVLATKVNADVIAFQEVSSVQAVREVLPDGGRDYEVCGFTSHKVQRLAFAWKRKVASAVGSCEVYAPLALPDRPVKEQPRPGLSVTLRIGGHVTRFMTVHLKSSCVSPLEGGGGTRGQLASDDKACSVLQAQLQPLETWLQERSQGVDAVVMLGDFNRNIAHEASLPANTPVRSQGRSTNLWREVNDGVPAASLLTALDTACPLDATSAALCKDAKSRVLDKPEMAQLTDAKALGCRNPIGLDHIAVRLPAGAAAGAVPVAEKVALGFLGRTLEASDKRPEPLLAVSDHCPLRARLSL